MWLSGARRVTPARARRYLCVHTRRCLAFGKSLVCGNLRHLHKTPAVGDGGRAQRRSLSGQPFCKRPSGRSERKTLASTYCS